MAASSIRGSSSIPTPIEATFGAGLGRRMIAFAYNTPVFTLDLIRRLAIACEARQNGTLRAAYHEKNADEVETTAEQCIRRGMPVSVARPQCACGRRREPIDTSGPCWIGAAATCSR